jgi:hypothetical protein
MGFHVKFDDVTAFGFFKDGKIAEWSGQLDELGTAFSRIMDMTSFQGEAAASVKNYLSQVHVTAMASIVELMSEFRTKYLLYKDVCHGDV